MIISLVWEDVTMFIDVQENAKLSFICQEA